MVTLTRQVYEPVLLFQEFCHSLIQLIFINAQHCYIQQKSRKTWNKHKQIWLHVLLGREMQLLATLICFWSFPDISERPYIVHESPQKKTGQVGDAPRSNDMETFTCLLAGLSSYDEIWSGQSF